MRSTCATWHVCRGHTHGGVYLCEGRAGQASEREEMSAARRRKKQLRKVCRSKISSKYPHYSRAPTIYVTHGQAQPAAAGMSPAPPLLHFFPVPVPVLSSTCAPGTTR